jgi:hypothetical protein
VFEYEHAIHAEQLHMNASFLNVSAEVMTDFMFQAAVPKVTSRTRTKFHAVISHASVLEL